MDIIKHLQITNQLWAKCKQCTLCPSHLPSPHRACLGQCFSYSVPNTFPQSTESLIHCDSCMPAQTQWEVVRVIAHKLMLQAQTTNTSLSNTHADTHTHRLVSLSLWGHYTDFHSFTHRHTHKPQVSNMKDQQKHHCSVVSTEWIRTSKLRFSNTREFCSLKKTKS